MKNKWLYIIIIVLTVFDIIFTTWGLKVGFIEEVNPLFDFFYSQSYLLAISLVILITGGFLYIIFRLQGRSKIAKAGLILVAAVKTYVLIMHLNWFLPIVPLIIHRYKVGL